MKGYIYIHRNKKNGKMYIGQSTQENPNSRWLNGIGYKNSIKFWGAIQKYGWDGFDHFILPKRYETQEELNEAEIDMIKVFDTVNKGYNISDGGFNNPMSSPMSRRKNSKAKMGKLNPMYGKCGNLNAKSVPVEQYDLSGKFIAEYQSFNLAATAIPGDNNNIRPKLVRNAKGKSHTAYGFIWKYKKGDD